jgi:hypothetical protein
VHSHALAMSALLALSACGPSAPTAPEVPSRDVEFRVTTTPSLADQRFLVEFRSLSDRTLCISANEWPTAQGELGANRQADAGDQPHRVRPGDTLSATVRFDQVPAAARVGDGARQVDFVPDPVFCTSTPQ